MDYFDRITDSNLEFQSSLFEIIEDLKENNVEALLEALEQAVSNGWMGEASSICEILSESSLLDLNSRWRIRFELERMKKYHYFGLNEQARIASKRTLHLLDKAREKLDIKDFYLWKFTAIGQIGWIEEHDKNLQKILNQCEGILQAVTKELEIYEILEAFYLGLCGRYQFLFGDTEKARQLFQKALNSVEGRYIKVYSHLLVYYAECSFLAGLQENAYKIARNFHDNLNINILRTHLLIRIYSLLLKLSVVSCEQKKIFSSQFQTLVHAKGLVRAQGIYPILYKTMSLIPISDKIDFYDISLKMWIYNKIESINEWRHFEKLIKLYYENLGYKFVELLGESFPVFDLVATEEYRLGNRVTTLVQIKHWKTRKVNEVPSNSAFRDAFSKLQRKDFVHQIGVVTWFVYSGITDTAQSEITESVKMFFGKNCRVKFVSGITEVVDYYMKNVKKFMNLAITNDWEI